MELSIFSKGFEILKLRADGLQRKHGFVQSYNKAIEEISRESALFFTQNSNVKENCYVDKIEIFLDFDRYLKRLKRDFQTQIAAAQRDLAEQSIFRIALPNRDCPKNERVYTKAPSLLK